MLRRALPRPLAQYLRTLGRARAVGFRWYFTTMVGKHGYLKRRRRVDGRSGDDGTRDNVYFRYHGVRSCRTLNRIMHTLHTWLLAMVVSCLDRRSRYCSWTMKRADFEGWIKRGIKTNAATRSGSTNALKPKRRTMFALVDPLRLIHPTFEFRFVESA